MDAKSGAELRVRLYALCSRCAELIDCQQRKQPRQYVQPEDLLVHGPEQHSLFLEILGIKDES
jgi:hypothetical protein